jgi:hypothetical protein
LRGWRCRDIGERLPIAMYFFTIHVTVYKFDFMNYYHDED